MKRRDMLGEIEVILSKELTGFYEGNIIQRKKDSKRILDFIEKRGMLPPSYRYEDGDLGSCFKNEWESEDEKK